MPAAGVAKGRLPGQNGGGWNFNNMGTCERKLDWFFQNCVNQTNKGGVDAHFSGHSHRAGVYTTAIRGGAVTIESAFDPGLQFGHAANSAEAGKTKFIVSSCGGPIGVQNLNHELGGWTLTPPSGTRYDGASNHPVQQVAFSQGNAKPRLAVALDYMHIMNVERVLHWEPAKGNAQLRLVVGPKTQKLKCIASIRLWGYSTQSSSWIGFDTKLKLIREESGTAWGKPIAAVGSGIYQMTIPANNQTDLKDLLAETLSRWFCEVGLKAPTGFPADHFKLDPWFFPVDVKRRETDAGPILTLRRRFGEHGEVPDWLWLNMTFGADRYPDPKDVTKVY